MVELPNGALSERINLLAPLRGAGDNFIVNVGNVSNIGDAGI